MSAFRRDSTIISRRKEGGSVLNLSYVLGGETFFQNATLFRLGLFRNIVRVSVNKDLNGEGHPTL